MTPIRFCKEVVLKFTSLEYRGYGLSTGTPNEKGLYVDGRAAVDYLFTRHDLDHSQIILFGRSLGGAIVSYEVDFIKIFYITTIYCAFR